MIQRETRKLKVALLKDSNKELIADIDKAIDRTHQIVQRNVKLEPMRIKRKLKHPPANLRIIRKHAASLHNVLVTKKSWGCPCKRTHVVSLRLETRPRTLEKFEFDQEHQPTFRILLSSTRESQIPVNLRGWRELEVKPFVDEDPTDLSQVSSCRERKGVRFASEVPMKTRISPSSQGQKLIAANICVALGKTSTTRECLGFLADEEDLEHKHHLYLAETLSAHEPQTRSLGELLTIPTSPSSSTVLFRKDRLEIAVTLASSVLQLDATPWLKSQWTSNDIYFHDDISPDRHPYLPWKPCTIDGAGWTDTKPLDLKNPFIRSKVLFSLGLILVELCFGSTLKSLQELEESHNEEEIARMNCAFRLLESRAIWKTMGEVYESVVRRCLNQTFDVPNMDLNDEDFQHQVYQNVVAPLADELNDFLGKSRFR